MQDLKMADGTITQKKPNCSAKNAGFPADRGWLESEGGGGQ